MTKAHSELHDNDGKCESCDKPAPVQTTYPVLLADMGEFAGEPGWGTIWLCPDCFERNIERDKDKGWPFDQVALWTWRTRRLPSPSNPTIVKITSPTESPMTGSLYAIGNNVIVRDIEVGGDGHATRGTVASAGTTVTGPAGMVTLVEGDRIAFRKYSGHELVVEGEKFLVVSRDDVLAVIMAGKRGN